MDKLHNVTNEAFGAFACSISLTAEAKPKRNEATGLFQECLNGHSQLVHMRIRYHFIANLHITLHLKKRV